MVKQVDLKPFFAGKSIAGLLFEGSSQESDAIIILAILYDLGLLRIRFGNGINSRELIDDSEEGKRERLKILRDFVVACFGCERHFRLCGEAIYVDGVIDDITEVALEEVYNNGRKGGGANDGTD